ncbi:MAG TPA: hypothetical protein VJW51_01890 [Candidatus Acidoferrales bacterium]|nr:hypothetical protein [Candidatus Acidoferrales bacterium]
MRRSLTLPLALLCAVLGAPAAARAQIGKAVHIAAGTPEDQLVLAINSANTDTEKIALLDKYMAEHSKDEMAIVALEQYVAIYSAAKNYEKAFVYGDQGLAADPDNYGIAYSVFRAAQEKGDVEHEFRYGEALAGLVARYKSREAPAGEDADAWAASKRQALADIAEAMNYVSVSLFNVARGAQDPRVQTALLERYAIAFADSSYAEQVQALVADNYRRQGEYAKMSSFAEQVLVKDPDNIGMLVMLADDGSDRGVKLDQADRYAHRALDVLGKAQKPAGMTEELWAQRVAQQQGIAWSSIGQVAIQMKKDAAALEAFQKAAPLLKAQAFLYARNQYRMGFALLNLKRTADARTALTQAASVDTPYKQLALDKLNSLPPGGPAKKKS